MSLIAFELRHNQKSIVDLFSRKYSTTRYCAHGEIESDQMDNVTTSAHPQQFVIL